MQESSCPRCGKPWLIDSEQFQHAGPVAKMPTGSVDPQTDTRMDKLPMLALLEAARALRHGMKYERAKPDNWRGVPAEAHLDHALRHIALYQSGDRSEQHVGHAISRLMMWGELCISQ